jgi:integral membrane sensor domain MASE1
VLPVLGVAAIYFGAAKLGLLQELVRGQVTPFWPPTGIALAALLLLGLRAWPGIALGAFVLNATVGSSLLAAAIITLGNTVAPVCAYLLLRRVDFRSVIDRRRDALALVFLGALVPMLVSATIGAAALLLTGGIGAAGFASTWWVWWTGDATGVLVVTPLLLVLRYQLPDLRTVHWHRWAEAACLLLSTFLVAVIAVRSSYEVLFVIFPFLIWAALRFQLLGAAPCALIVTTVAIVAAAGESGPFARHDLLANMATLQAFNGSTALTALVLAAIIAERNQAYGQIERAVSQLAGAVERLDVGHVQLRLTPPPASKADGA